jgi:probable HAF family extracellular repeat protein
MEERVVTHQFARRVVAIAAGMLAATAAFPANAVRQYTATALEMFESVPVGGVSAINNRGQILGSVETPVPGPSHAFLYSGGKMIDLGTLGGTNSAGRGVNDNGQATGVADTAVPGVQHAFLYSGGKMADLGTLGGTNSQGYGINASGQISGTADTAVPGAQHAFLYSGGKMTDLGTLGGAQSTGFGMNDGGQVVGTADRASGGEHAFLYSSGNMVDLGVPDSLAFNSTRGLAINNKGEIVGDANRTKGGLIAGFLYSDGKMVDLNTLVVGGPGVYLLTAFAINDSGQILALSIDGKPYRLDPAAAPMAVTDIPTLSREGLVTMGLLLLATGLLLARRDKSCGVNGGSSNSRGRASPKPKPSSITPAKPNAASVR